MALATRCPHCHTTFRVVHDQLKLRSGMVRCGNCQQVFNGIEHLIRANTPGTPAPAPAPAAAAPAAAPATPVVAAATAALATSAPSVAAAAMPATMPTTTPTTTPALLPDTASAVSGAIQNPGPDAMPPPAVPSALAPSAEPMANAATPPMPPTSAAPLPASPVVATPDEAKFTVPEVVPSAESALAPVAEPPALPETALQPAPVPEPAPAPLHGETLVLSRIEPQLDDNTSWPEAKPAAMELAAAMAHHQEPQLFDEQSGASPARSDADDEDEDEPSFVKSGRRQQKLRRVWSVLQATCFVILLTALLGQCLYTWRDIVAVRWPASKIMLFNACTLLHCKVGLPTQIQHLSIELGELQVLPRNKNTFSYTTALRNQSGTLQAWPSIELVLLDNNETPVARRVFGPADYLPNPAEARKGFGPQAEQAIKMYFEFHQLKAASYRAEIFYP